jgi:DNA-binding MarR family transcriptional regulator
MLLALQRAPEHQLSAGALLRGSQVTAGAITNRVARLEKRGYQRREIDPADRRQILVTLTAAGRRRASRLLAIHTTAEQRLLGQAGSAAIGRMCEDLRNLLLAIEGPARDDHPYEACSVPAAGPVSAGGEPEAAVRTKAKPAQRAPKRAGSRPTPGG